MFKLRIFYNNPNQKWPPKSRGANLIAFGLQNGSRKCDPRGPRVSTPFLRATTGRIAHVKGCRPAIPTPF